MLLFHLDYFFTGTRLPFSPYIVQKMQQDRPRQNLAGRGSRRPETTKRAALWLIYDYPAVPLPRGNQTLALDGSLLRRLFAFCPIVNPIVAVFVCSSIDRIGIIPVLICFANFYVTYYGSRRRIRNGGGIAASHCSWPACRRPAPNTTAYLVIIPSCLFSCSGMYDLT